MCCMNGQFPTVSNWDTTSGPGIRNSLGLSQRTVRNLDGLYRSSYDYLFESLPGVFTPAISGLTLKPPTPSGEAGQGGAAVRGGQPAPEQPALAGGVPGSQ